MKQKAQTRTSNKIFSAIIFSLLSLLAIGVTTYFFQKTEAGIIEKIKNIRACNITKMDVQEFSSSGLWTKPENLAFAVVEIWGAEGGPNSITMNRDPSIYQRGGGQMDPMRKFEEGYYLECQAEKGGAGGYGKALLTAKKIPASVEIVIGQGGKGGKKVAYPSSFYTSNGENASTTSFGELFSLSGGQGAGQVTERAPPPGIPSEFPGKPGTATGADFFSLDPVYGKPGKNAQEASAENKGSEVSVGRPAEAICSVWGGRGHDGHITITSFLCD